jgi:hypothetical protein
MILTSRMHKYSLILLVVMAAGSLASCEEVIIPQSKPISLAKDYFWNAGAAPYEYDDEGVARTLRVQQGVGDNRLAYYENGELIADLTFRVAMLKKAT